MKAQAWIQHQLKKKMKLIKGHWLKAKQDNINMILQSQMQILMAERILIMIDEEIAKFPVEPKEIPKAVQ